MITLIDPSGVTIEAPQDGWQEVDPNEPEYDYDHPWPPLLDDHSGDFA